MDKIQELHYDAWLSTSGIHKTVEKHAAITEDMMGRFAEWVSKQKWVYHSSASIWVHPKYPRCTTTELIQLFKETL